MPWFAAKCKFLSLHTGNEPEHENLGEYRYFLVQAANEQKGMEAPVAMAKTKEHSFENVYGATVTWAFEGVLELKEILDKQPISGTELYSEFFSS
jgi:hypothetical protein